MNAYNDVWHAGLFLFGLHLLVVGYLAFKSGYVPKLIAVLVAIDGLSYVVDTFGTVLSPGHWTDTATYTFIGELLLGLWLVIRGRRLTLNAPGLKTGRPEHRVGAFYRRHPRGRLRVGGLCRRARPVRRHPGQRRESNDQGSPPRHQPAGIVIVNGGGSPGHIIGAVGSILRATIVNLFVRQRITMIPTTWSREDLLAVTELVANGTLHPVIDRT